MMLDRVKAPGQRNLPLHLVEELNHRVINEFAEAISMLSLASQAPAPDAKVAIADAAARLRAHAEAHRTLAPPRAGASMNLGAYLSKLCAAMTGSWLGDHAVQLTVRSEDIWMATERAWRIGLVVAELVRNAHRHGLVGRSGAIVVRTGERSGIVTCLVADSGSGKPDAAPGRGSRLVRSLVEELGGHVDWHFSSRGTLACLNVPKDEEVDFGPGASPVSAEYRRQVP